MASIPSASAGLDTDYVRMDFKSWDITFALRSHAPAENRHARGLSAAGAKEEVFHSPRLQRIMQEVCEDREVCEDEVEGEVREILAEMGHSMFLPAVRIIALLLRPFIRSALHGIFVNRAGLEQAPQKPSLYVISFSSQTPHSICLFIILQRTALEWPVVLLPSHRSYLDFLLISYIMFEHNIRLPYIAAGQDFMKMKLVGSLLRQSGAFFMRRMFGTDRLYKAVFSEYVKTVLCSNDAPLEFFIEGTRSRTAKTLHPKLGLLSIVVEPYLAGLVPDIMMVPVSISYERTLEEWLFSNELLGVPKPPESTLGLMKALSIISGDYGSIFAEIGQPISLHDFCSSRGVSRIPHTVYPKDKSVILPSERQVILELSHVILDHTHHGMRIYPTAMTATLILQHSAGLERGELMRQLEWLKAQVLLRGSKIHWEGDTGSNLDFALKTLSSSLEKTSAETVRPVLFVSALPPGPRGHNIEEVMKLELTAEESRRVTDLAFTRLLLSHYRNQLLHLFTAEAMLALSVYHCLPCRRATARKRFETLHCALSREFVLPLCSPQELFFSTLMMLIDRGFLVMPHGGEEISQNDQQESGFEFLKCLIQPFVEGVWVVCHHLVMFSGGVQSLTTTVKSAQTLAIKCIHSGVLESFDPLSLDVIRNSLASLTQLGLIRQPESEVEGRDRLVKVDKQKELVQLASQLGAILGRTESISAKL